MFSTLGLFHTIACPESSICIRNPCPFSHRPLSDLPPSATVSALDALLLPEPVVQTSTTASPEVLSTRSNPFTSTSIHAKRPALSQPSSSAEPPRKIQKVNIEPSGPVIRHATSTGVQKSSVNESGPPIFRINVNDSKIPIRVRQQMLTLLWEWFCAHYAAILPSNPSIATEHAFKQELEIYSKTNKTTYRNAVISAIASMKKRPAPDRISHPSVGTEGMVAERAAAEKSLTNFRLTSADLRGLTVSRSELERWGYILQVPSESGGLQPSEEGNEKMCDRCKQRFVVKRMTEAPSKKCVYHWGRAFRTTINGEKTRIYKCCSRMQDVAGCETGPHVFYESDAKELHSRHAFTLSSSEDNPSTVLDVAALDCEAVYSTQGMSVARVSVVDGKGVEVFDELIRLDSGVEIIDYNTRFSGIKSLEGAVLDLAGVRQALRSLIGPDTILIGHSLDSDLKMMRMIHYNIIDTAILFPHPAGAPYRRALRDLAKEHLGTVIQSGGASGHSSVEDSTATLNLVKWFVLEQRKRCPTASNSRS